MLIDLLVSLFLLIGAGFTLVGSIGMVRLPDFFTRLHGPTKATTLGVGGMLVASVIHFSARGQGVSLRELLIAVFLFITAPLSAHLMTKAALHLGLGTPPPPPSEKRSDAPNTDSTGSSS
jgi:multicomponent K+:H+ antiporter subunit G